MKEFYPKLNESPDRITFKHNRYSFYDSISNAKPFVCEINLLSDKIVNVNVGKVKTSHYDSMKTGSNSSTKIIRRVYPGRLFFEPKVITFWTYPNNEELKDTINLLEKKLDIKIFNNDWNIETYKKISKGSKTYFSVRDQNRTDKMFVSIDEY